MTNNPKFRHRAIVIGSKAGKLIVRQRQKYARAHGIGMLKNLFIEFRPFSFFLIPVFRIR